MKGHERLRDLPDLARKHPHPAGLFLENLATRRRVARRRRERMTQHNLWVKEKGLREGRPFPGC
jgi:hypothetical protein